MEEVWLYLNHINHDDFRTPGFCLSRLITSRSRASPSQFSGPTSCWTRSARATSVLDLDRRRSGGATFSWLFCMDRLSFLYSSFLNMLDHHLLYEFWYIGICSDQVERLESSNCKSSSIDLLWIVKLCDIVMSSRMSWFCCLEYIVLLFFSNSKLVIRVVFSLH